MQSGPDLLDGTGFQECLVVRLGEIDGPSCVGCGGHMRVPRYNCIRHVSHQFELLKFADPMMQPVVVMNPIVNPSYILD
jgi:hypothetical protein